MVMIKRAYAVDSYQVCGKLGVPISYKSAPNLSPFGTNQHVCHPNLCISSNNYTKRKSGGSSVSRTVA